MSSEDNLAFGIWLECEIYRRHITKSELAARLGVSPSVITQWTNGETQPSYPRIAALAALLDVGCYEVYLRLGHIKPRPELDTDWEVFITKVERDGLEFKRFVLNGLDDMRAAWLTRPRRSQAVMRVAAASLFDYSNAGLRGVAEWQEDRLLYYGPIHFSDGTSIELMLTARQVLGEVQVIADFIGSELPNHGMIRVGNDTYHGQIIGTSLHFAPIALCEADPPLTMIFERPVSDLDATDGSDSEMPG